MALPMSTWFCSRRLVVGPLSGKSAAALTMNSRVHVIWSSHSLRIASWKADSLADFFLSNAGEAETVGASRKLLAPMANETRSTIIRVDLIWRLIVVSPFIQDRKPFICRLLYLSRTPGCPVSCCRALLRRDSHVMHIYHLAAEIA